ncbi:MAG TPA: RQC domain-containing protein, partial [Thermoanaerobaculia bacterium]|nr:RQC domain-containing protein [Thermoanaerobaculia bacterium]
VISVLRGENIERVRDRNHDQLSTYGIMREHSRNELRDLIYQLVSQGLLQQTGDEYPVLTLTEASRAVLRGEAKIRLRQPVVPKKKEARPRRSFVVDGDYDTALFDALRRWRRGEAERRNVPPYVIFSDRTLREVARVQPTTLTALRGVYGVGDAKLEQFGEDLITRVREHASSGP